MKIVTSNARIAKVVEDCVNYIAVSYGPAGRKVLIKDEHRLRSVDDGKIILDSYELENEADNAVIEYIKEAASKTDLRAGDWTTTSLLVMGATVKGVLGKEKNILEGDVNPHGSLIEIRKAADEAIAYIKEKAKPVKTEKELYTAAYTSSNNEEIAKLVSHTIYTIGKDGVLSVKDSHTALTEIEKTEGMELEKGYVSPHLTTNKSGDRVDIDSPYVLLVNQKLEFFNDLVPILSLIKGKSLLVIADGFSDMVIASFLVAKAQGLVKPLLIENPSYGELKLEFLKDIASVSGATVFDPKAPNADIKLWKVDNLGQFSSAIAYKSTTTILGGIKPVERIKQLKAELEKAQTDFDKDKLVRRIAALSGGVSIIKVGANTQNEQETKRLKVEDTVNATRLAFRSGVVKGGGRTLESIKTSSDIFNTALKAPRARLEKNGKEFLSENVSEASEGLIAAIESATSIACGVIELAGVIATKREKKTNPEY